MIGTADLSTVVKHIHLLDIKARDSQEELDVARYWSSVASVNL